MPNFKYVTKDSEGQTINGVMDGKDRAAVIDSLRKKNLIIISVDEAVSKFGISKLLSMKRKIKMDDLVVFSRQLATMVDAGVPLVGALDVLSDQVDNKTFGDVVKNISRDVETGSSLSEAMSRHKTVFSTLFISMVKAGEASGMLDEILDRVAEYFEKTSALQRKVKSALVYPAIVSLMAVIITLFLIIRVIPIFKNIFEGFGAQLPTPTMILLGISDVVRQYFLLVMAVIAVAAFLVSKYLKTEGGMLKRDYLFLNAPIFGILIRKVAISKFSRTLSTLIKSGVPILLALDIVAKTSGNKVVEISINNVRNNVREGESIAEPLARSKIFPPMVTKMVRVGEQSGELEKMLSKIADFYDEQVDAAVTALTSMIEPLIIAFLGIVIGSIVVCMFLPIFKLTSIVGT